MLRCEIYSDAGKTRHLEMLQSIRLNLPSIFVFLCVCYTFVGFLGCSRGSFSGRLLRGLPLMAGDFLGILWVLSVDTVYLTGINRKVVTVSVLVFLVGILAIPLSWLTVGVIYPVYIVGDASWILWLCLSLMIFGGSAHKNHIHLDTIYRLLVFLCTILFVYWIALGVYHQALDAPHFIVFCFILSGIITSCFFDRKRSRRVAFYLVISVVLLAFAFLGWGRGLFLGFLFSFMACLLMIFHVRNVKVVGLVCCILLLLSGVLCFSLGDKFSKSRLYRSVATREVLRGQSASERLDEVHSARRTLQASPGIFLTGLGHGAVYFPCVGALNKNLTTHGHIHNIHVGPALLFFRYGILGVIFYGACWFVVVKGFLLGRRLCKLRKRLQLTGETERYFSVRLFYTNYFVFCTLFIYSHLSNHFLNPFFGVSLAIVTVFISEASPFKRGMRQLR